MKPKKKVTTPKTKPLKKVATKKPIVKSSTKVKGNKTKVNRILDKSVKTIKAADKKKSLLSPLDLKMLVLVGKCYKFIIKDKKTKKISDEKYINLLSWDSKLQHFKTRTLTKVYNKLEADYLYIITDNLVYETLPKGYKAISENEFNKQMRLFINHLNIPSEGRTFTIDAKEEARFNKWTVKTNVKHSHAGAAGGAYTWSFIPTGLGILVEVEDINGNKIILRGTENW